MSLFHIDELRSSEVCVLGRQVRSLHRGLKQWISVSFQLVSTTALPFSPDFDKIFKIGFLSIKSRYT